MKYAASGRKAIQRAPARPAKTAATAQPEAPAASSQIIKPPPSPSSASTPPYGAGNETENQSQQQIAIANSGVRGKSRMMLPGRTFIARHGETVFNAAARMQGQMHVHTPLTVRGFAQADEMARSLATWLKDETALTLWSSTAGRALQTLAIIAEHIDADWHAARTDDRLQEIDVGDWSGRSYAEIEAEIGPFVDREAMLFTIRASGGEWYDGIATRLRAWIADAAQLPGDRLVIMHGISSRVLRGILLDLPDDPRWNAPVATNLPQGTMVVIENGQEEIVRQGGGTELA